MLVKKTSTYLGLDLSINGTGICLVSNDPAVAKKFQITKLSKSKFFLAEASFVDGSRKDQFTTYTQKLWTPEGIVSGEKHKVPLYLRAHTVYHQYMAKFIELDLNGIIVEGNAFAGKGKVFDMAEFIGQLKYMIEVPYLNKGAKAPIKLVPPTNLKLYTTGKGKEDENKSRMLEAVSKRYGIDLINHNICDSFALAIMGAELGDELDNFTKKGIAKELKEYRRKIGIAS